MNQTAEQLEEELLTHVRALPTKQQQRVLEFARSLSGGTLRGLPGRELRKFAGTIDPEDVCLMIEAIEGG